MHLQSGVTPVVNPQPLQLATRTASRVKAVCKLRVGVHAALYVFLYMRYNIYIYMIVTLIRRHNNDQWTVRRIVTEDSFRRKSPH